MLTSSGIMVSEWSKTKIKTEIEIDDEFCASTDAITYGKIEPGDIKPVIVPDFYGFQKYETSSKFSSLISQSTDNISLSLRCRLCAMPNNHMVDIFSSIGTEEGILDKVRKSLPIVIEESDSLPKQACRSCLATLELCYQFHQTVVQAERQLLAFDRFASSTVSEADTNNDSFPVCGRQRAPTEYHNIDTSLKTASDIEMNNIKSKFFSDGNQTGDTTVNSNVLLSSLRPCSVVIPIMETYWKNNSAIGDERSSSRNNGHKNLDSTTETLLPGRIIASATDQQSTYDSGVHLNSPDIHIPADIGERHYTCNTCAKTFKRESSPIRHNLVHSNEKLYTCEYCEKKFPNIWQKKYHHRRIHLKKGTFECLLCEKSFTSTSDLKRHAVVHSKDRNYHCSLCDKSFKTLSTRNGHMKIHTSIKQWQCSYCKKSFLRQFNFKAHSVRCKKRY